MRENSTDSYVEAYGRLQKKPSDGLMVTYVSEVNLGPFNVTKQAGVGGLVKCMSDECDESIIHKDSSVVASVRADGSGEKCDVRKI